MSFWLLKKAEFEFAVERLFLRHDSIIAKLALGLLSIPMTPYNKHQFCSIKGYQ